MERILTMKAGAVISLVSRSDASRQDVAATQWGGQ
jgi:hypothetical protein